MALQYTKEELEAIATRLQCCAADAANEALTGEIFLDAEKEKCGWYKFKYLQAASNILKGYYPGGLYPFTENLVIENTIPVEGEPYNFKCAVSVDNHSSPFFGFSFVVFGNTLTFEDAYIYVIKDGLLYASFNTDAFLIGPVNVNSIAYDGKNHNLILGCNENIQEVDITILLTDPTAIPTVINTVSTPLSYNNNILYNYKDKYLYILDITGSQILKLDTNTDTYVAFALINPPNNSSCFEINRITGELWIANNGPDITIMTMSGSILTNFSISGGLYIYDLSYNTATDQFIVSYFDGVTNKVILVEGDGTPLGGSVLETSESINDALYFNGNDNYLVSTDFELLVADKPSIELQGTLNLIQDIVTERVIASGTIYPDDTQVNYISIISVPKDTECLTDDDVQNVIEMSQQFCCDCCAPETIQGDYDAFSTTPLQEVSETPGSPKLFGLYYGKNTNPTLGVANPANIATLANVNRYAVQDVYNYNITPSVSYYYFVVPTNMPQPNGFYNATTGTVVSMEPPYLVTYLGVTYKVYRSTISYTSGISLKVI